MTDPIGVFAREVVASFRDWECHVVDPSGDRDGALVAHVLRALAEGGCPATAAVLEDIDRRRACEVTT